MDVVILKQAKRELEDAPKDGRAFKNKNKEHWTMKAKIERYKTAKEFGAALGLSEVEMELIRQKKKLIEKLKD